MVVGCHHRLRRLLPGLVGALLWTSAVAMVPDEVTGAAFADNSTLTWAARHPSPDFYNIYRGSISDLSDGSWCHGFDLQTNSFTADEEPAIGEGSFFLITAKSLADGKK